MNLFYLLLIKILTGIKSIYLISHQVNYERLNNRQSQFGLQLLVM